ncbi:helix-turn-helix domain-containing protein [Haloglycomyces albus]|uniref:helix-turn-helix domain-containing protein n=1 Tax=Haloglycomyces albus TaxID=526067 RepID=UPI00046D2B5E|nr:helix-turn-helix transcriptional regulator [Haloglycomyces albus]
MVLMREMLGQTLRRRRRAQRRTLREVSKDANVSLGYLSEIERGHKEPSSELLSSVCGALQVKLSEVLADVTREVSRAERDDHVETDATQVRVLPRPQLPATEHRRPLGGGDKHARPKGSSVPVNSSHKRTTGGEVTNSVLESIG